MISELALIVATAGWATSATTAALAYRHRLHTDELTGIGNRTALYRKARRARRYRGLVGPLMVDLDRFKAINDTYGHAFGNRVLTAVAARLANTAQPGELAVRLHGDEFALWLGHVESPTHAERRADEVAAALTKPLWVDGHSITAAGSVGVATGPARELADLLRQADARTYEAKAGRRLTTVASRAFQRTRDFTPGGAA